MMSIFKRTAAFLLGIAVLLSLFALPAYAEEKEIEPYGSWAEWTDIKSLYAGGYILYGIKNDGSVVACYSIEDPESIISYYGEDFYSSAREVLSWSDLDSLYSLNTYSEDYVMGLKTDGTVIFNSVAEEKMICDAEGLRNVKEIVKNDDNPPVYYLLHEDGSVSGITSRNPYDDGNAFTGFESAKEIRYIHYSRYDYSAPVAVTGAGKIVWPRPDDPTDKGKKQLLFVRNSATADWEEIEKAFYTRYNSINLILGRKSDGSTCCRSFSDYDYYEKRRMPFLEQTIELWNNIQDIGHDYYAEDLIVFTDDGMLKGVKPFYSCTLNADGTYSGSEKFSLISFRDLDVASFKNGNILLRSGEYYAHERDSDWSYAERARYSGETQLKEVVGSYPLSFGLTTEGTVVTLGMDEYGEDQIGAELTSVQPGEPGDVNLWDGSYNFEFRLRKETESYTSEAGFVYTLLDDEAYITCYEGEAPEGQFAIPDAIDGHKVVYVSGIECGAQDVLIPDTVKAVSLHFSKASAGRVLLPSSVLGYEAYYDNCPLPEICWYDAASPAANAAA